MSFVKNIILTYKNNTLIYLRFFAAFDFLSDSKTNGYRFWQFRCGFSVKRPSLSRGGRISRHSLTALIGAEQRLDDRPAFGPGKSFFLQKM